jgi:Transposase, Mutator family
MRKVPAPKVVTTLEVSESPLPSPVQEALGELVGAAREGLLALSVGVGLGVVHELMELEVDEVVGPKGKHNLDRTAKRHGHEDGSMTLGGRRVAVRRPRMRTADDKHELPVATYRYFADRDPLTRAVMDRMLAGVSTRKFARVGEPIGEEVEASASATGKTAVSDLFSGVWSPRRGATAAPRRLSGWRPRSWMSVSVRRASSARLSPARARSSRIARSQIPIVVRRSGRASKFASSRSTAPPGAPVGPGCSAPAPRGVGADRGRLRVGHVILCLAAALSTASKSPEARR